MLCKNWGLQYNTLIPIPTRHSNIKQASQEKFDEQQAWHKLVVKVIIWKEGSSETGLTETIEKITTSEWNKYSEKIIKISTTTSQDKVLADLKQTLKRIEENGGLKDK